MSKCKLCHICECQAKEIKQLRLDLSAADKAIGSKMDLTRLNEQYDKRKKDIGALVGAICTAYYFVEDLPYGFPHE